MEYIEIINKLIGDINSACSERYENLISILKSNHSKKDEEVEWWKDQINTILISVKIMNQI